MGLQQGWILTLKFQVSVEFAEPIGQRTLISSPKFCTIFDAHGEPQDVGICFTVSACIALSDKIKCHPTSSCYLIGNQDNYATYLSKHLQSTLQDWVPVSCVMTFCPKVSQKWATLATLRKLSLFTRTKISTTLECGINIALRLLIFWLFSRR